MYFKGGTSWSGSWLVLIIHNWWAEGTQTCGTLPKDHRAVVDLDSWQWGRKLTVPAPRGVCVVPT